MKLELNKEALKAELMKQSNMTFEDVDGGAIHQTLLEIVYNWYNNNIAEERKNHPEHLLSFVYSDMIEQARQEFGSFVAFAVEIGKYNQQICNGGHTQYWSNGYASFNSCCLNDLYLHANLFIDYQEFYDDFLEMTKGEDVEELKDTLEKVGEILEEFPGRIEIVTRMNSYRFTIEGEPEDIETEDTHCLSGTSENELNYLDSRYYLINQKFEDILELFFRNCLVESEV